MGDQKGTILESFRLTICICVGGEYSRSTYDGYVAGSINGDKVVDDGFSLHHTMVWLRIFLWLEQKVPIPTKTYRAEGTWF